MKVPKINYMIFAGRVASDPSIKYTKDNRIVVNTIVAIDKSRQIDGAWVNAASFIPVVIFGKTAEYCQREMAKGIPVVVEGEIDVVSYMDKSGNKVWKTQVIANRVQVLKSIGEGSSNDDLITEEDDYDNYDTPF